MKTIKRERQVRLDELLKYVWDNGITDEIFENYEGSWVRFDEFGDLVEVYEVEESDLFTITEEVEIDEETKTPLIVAMNRNMFDRYANWSIQDLLDRDKKFGIDYKNIYILNDNGSIGELIWSKERGLVD